MRFICGAPEHNSCGLLTDAGFQADKSTSEAKGSSSQRGCKAIRTYESNRSEHLTSLAPVMLREIMSNQNLSDMKKGGEKGGGTTDNHDNRLSSNLLISLAPLA